MQLKYRKPFAVEKGRVHSARHLFVLFLCLSLPLKGQADVIAAMGAKENRASSILIGLVHTVKTEKALFVNPPGEPEEWVEDEHILTTSASYGTHGELQEKTEYAPDGAAIVRVVRTYNQANKLSTEQLYNAQDMLWRKTSHTYDEAGHLTEAVSTDVDDDLWFRDVYVSNENGQPAQVDHHDPDGTFLHRAIFAYDEAGRVAKRSLSDADGSPISGNVYQYDADGKIREIITLGRNGALASRWVFAYDERGNEREWVSYKVDGSIKRKEIYAYEYDTEGNWVKQVTSEWIPDGEQGYIEPAEAVYRTITYYPKEEGEITDVKGEESPSPLVGEGWGEGESQ